MYFVVYESDGTPFVVLFGEEYLDAYIRTDPTRTYEAFNDEPRTPVPNKKKAQQ